jgi:hypothetical protein
LKLSTVIFHVSWKFSMKRFFCVCSGRGHTAVKQKERRHQIN